jgi:GH25 family lysozyme M1 (1,4-beta-N-acetylmuramidase)
MRGLDLSVYQGAQDFSKLPANDQIKFVILKCAEAHSNAQDKVFAVNSDSAKAAGLKVGCYNFVHLDPSNDPSVQAALHFQASGGLGSNAGELPPCVDFEWPEPKDWLARGCTGPQLRAAALKYLDVSTSLWGCRPTLYTYPDFWMRVGGASEREFASYALWIASYQRPNAWPSALDAPIPLGPWAGNWSLWQTSGGQFYKLPNGASCDTDVFNGDAAALAAFCAGTRV